MLGWFSPSRNDAMTIVCPNCSEHFDVPRQAGGKRTVCPVCNESFTISSAKQASPASPEPMPAPTSATISGSVLALALALASAVSLFMPFIWPLAAPLAVVAIVFGLATSRWDRLNVPSTLAVVIGSVALFVVVASEVAGRAAKAIDAGGGTIQPRWRL